MGHCSHTLVAQPVLLCQTRFLCRALGCSPSSSNDNCGTCLNPERTEHPVAVNFLRHVLIMCNMTYEAAPKH